MTISVATTVAVTVDPGLSPQPSPPEEPGTVDNSWGSLPVLAPPQSPPAHSREEVVTAVRRYLKVPYLTQGRTRKGVDCIGLAIAVCWDLQIGNFDFTNYGGDPHGFALVERIGSVCEETATPLPGDLLVFSRKVGGPPSHCGFLVGDSMVHAWDRVRFVAEHDYTPWWQRRLASAFILPGVYN